MRFSSLCFLCHSVLLQGFCTLVPICLKFSESVCQTLYILCYLPSLFPTHQKAKVPHANSIFSACPNYLPKTCKNFISPIWTCKVLCISPGILYLQAPTLSQNPCELFFCSWNDSLIFTSVPIRTDQMTYSFMLWTVSFACCCLLSFLGGEVWKVSWFDSVCLNGWHWQSLNLGHFLFVYSSPDLESQMFNSERNHRISQRIWACVIKEFNLFLPYPIWIFIWINKLLLTDTMISHTCLIYWS